MTAETAEDLPSIEFFAEQLNVPWPIGYGADQTIERLRTPGIPMTFVVGRDGKIAWHSLRSGTLDGAIRSAL